MAEKKKGFDLAATLGSAPGVSKSDTQQGPLAFAYADIDSIHPDPYNAKVYELSDLGGLMDAILLEGGLQQPIYVVPDGDNWTVKSGHRRHAALTALVKGTDKQPPHPELRSVPIVYRPNSDAEDLARITDGDLDDDKAKELTRLMGELRVLIGNMGNRKQTPAELSAAAKELEDHYVALAGMGVRFPGRLRDRVAEACDVSASKLARLKVIRDKLTPAKFVQAWEAGELKEDPAYVLAQMPIMLQEAIAKYRGKLPSGEQLRRIQREGMEHYLCPSTTCKSGEGCTNGENFLRHDLSTSYIWDAGKCGCCVKCDEVASCKYVCPEGKRVAEKKKAKEAKEKEIADKKAEAAQNARLDFVGEIAKRVLAACEGKTEVFEAVKNKLEQQGMFCEWNLRSAVKSVAKGEALSDRGGYMGYRLFLPNWLAAFCRQVGTSADYILGLADDPMTQLAAAAPAETADGKPTWRSADKPPQKSGIYYVRVNDVHSMRSYAIDAKWNAEKGIWEDEFDHSNMTDSVLGWYPVPSADDEEVADDD